MQIWEIDPMLRQRNDPRIWEDCPRMRHEQQEDDDVEDQHVQSPPQRLVQPSVHYKPPVLN